MIMGEGINEMKRVLLAADQKESHTHFILKKRANIKCYPIVYNTPFEDDLFLSPKYLHQIN